MVQTLALAATSTGNLVSVARFHPYPDYKGTDIDWLNQIPSHWRVMRLKRVCLFQYGDSLPSENRTYGDVPVYGSNGAVGTHKCANALGPCLVIGRKGSFGRVNYCPTDVFAIDTAFYVDRRSTDADIRWLYYVLSHIRLDAASRDSAIPGLDREDAYARSVVLCDTNEQRAIVNFLDRETATIDALVAKKERLIELLDEKRSALITHAITKGIDPNAPMKNSGVECLGKIPAHWGVKRLWHLTAIGRPVIYGIVLPGPDVHEGIPIVKGGDVSSEQLRRERLSKTTRSIESHHARSRLRTGDLVYAIRGSIGDVAMIPPPLNGANLTQDAARVSYTSATCGPWLLHTLRSMGVFHQLSAGSLGATIRGINIRDLRRALIPVPPVAEQRAIASFVELETDRIDALLAKVYEAVERLKELRVALIAKATTGKMDVRDAV